MTEADRINSIRTNGGRHLQKFACENRTYAMCLAAVEEDGTAIEFVPENFKNADLYLRAAQTTPSIMQTMPKEYFSVDFAIAVIKQYGVTAIGSIPKEYKNLPIYLSIVEVVPQAIFAIPKANHTKELCNAVIRSMGCKSTAEAVIQEPSLLSQLPTSMYDHDSCLAFVTSDLFKTIGKEKSGYNTNKDYEEGNLYLQNRYHDHYSLKHILRWLDVCDIALSIYPTLIKFVKRDILTREMCIKAFNANTRVFQLLPDEFKDAEISLRAFEDDPYCLKYIPHEYLTYDICKIAVQHSGYLLEDIPLSFRTKELCTIAIISGHYRFEDVPESVLDEELCLVALNANGSGSYGMLQKIPESLRTYNVCKVAVTCDSVNLSYVPTELKTYELCLLAVCQARTNSTLNLLARIPSEFYTEELLSNMFAKGLIKFNQIPAECLSEKLCMDALNSGTVSSSTIMDKIPLEILTSDMANRLVESSYTSITKIPEHLITKEMIIVVGKKSAYMACKYAPRALRTTEFLNRLITECPGFSRYSDEFLAH